MRKTLSFSICLVVAGLGASACAAELDATPASALTRGALAGTDRCSEPDACLFGEVFADVRTSSALEIASEGWIRAPAELDALSGEQLVRAVQQSSHSGVTTPAEALARVDQNEVRRIDFVERATGRLFVVFEYGAGDNSYGAYFALDSPEVLASIHDGDVLDCTVFPARSPQP